MKKVLLWALAFCLAFSALFPSVLFFFASAESAPTAEPIPAPKEVDLASIRYAADRCDPDVKFTDEALKNFVKIPRPFLKTVLNGCVAWAKENGVTELTAEHIKIINDKRNAEKQKRK